jgi:hypothetical protein
VVGGDYYSQSLLLYGASLRVVPWELSFLLSPWQFSNERLALCPSLILQGGFSIPQPPMSVLDYRSQPLCWWYVCWGEGRVQASQGLHWTFFLGWVGG